MAMASLCYHENLGFKRACATQRKAVRIAPSQRMCGQPPNSSADRLAKECIELKMRGRLVPALCCNIAQDRHLDSRGTELPTIWSGRLRKHGFPCEMRDARVVRFPWRLFAAYAGSLSVLREAWPFGDPL